ASIDGQFIRALRTLLEFQECFRRARADRRARGKRALLPWPQLGRECAVGENTGKLGDLTDPAAVSFLLNFNRKVVHEKTYTSDSARKYQQSRFLKHLMDQGRWKRANACRLSGTPVEALELIRQNSARNFHPSRDKHLERILF